VEKAKMEATDGMGTFKSIKTTEGFLSRVQVEKEVFVVILALFIQLECKKTSRSSKILSMDPTEQVDMVLTITLARIKNFMLVVYRIIPHMATFL
jgi:hypothetical protein